LLPYPLFEVIYLVPLLFLISLFFLLRKGRNIDLIHTPGLNASLIGICLKFLTGKKIVMSTHTVYGFRKERWFLRKVIGEIVNSVDSIMAISQRSKEELLDWGVTEDRIIVHTTWVNQRIFKALDKRESRRELNWKEGNFFILFVGRLFKHKGTDLVIQTALELACDYKDIEFVVIGTGDEEEKMKETSAKVPNLNFLGYVPNEKIPIYYSASDLLIMPSWDIEPFGRVAAEALSCGLPVLARAESGFLDIADSTVSRAILPEIPIIKKEILSLYSDRKTLAKMSEKAVEFAGKHFSEDNVKTLLEAYDM
jgi:glycosyltransferase involved in cell wall biosynthesis